MKYKQMDSRDGFLFQGNLNTFSHLNCQYILKTDHLKQNLCNLNLNLILLILVTRNY